MAGGTDSIIYVFVPERSFRRPLIYRSAHTPVVPGGWNAAALSGHALGDFEQTWPPLYRVAKNLEQLR